MPDPASTFEDTLRLVERAQGDDGDAIQALFARYLPRIRRIAALRLGRGSQSLFDSDDIVQEAMLDALRGLPGFDLSSEGRFCNWLATIVENRVRMALRSESAQKRGGGAVEGLTDTARQIADPAPSPTSHARQAEVDERIERTLLSMTRRYREVLIHRTFCQMSYADVAEQMGLSGENSARSLHSKALREFAQRLESAADQRASGD